MAKKKYILTIPEPCHAQWARMSPCGGGRFCGNCRKTVVDFTNLTDDSVVRVLEQADEELCGRMNPSQLNRIVAESEVQPSFFKKLLKIAAGILLPALLHTPEAKAQGGIRMREVTTPKPGANQQDTLTPHGVPLPGTQSAQRVPTLLGIVLDSTTRQPLIGVSVVLDREHKIAAVTDYDGNFKLEFSDSFLKRDSITLELRYIGFEPATVRIARQNFSVKQELLMRESTNVLMGEVVITVKEKAPKKPRTKSKE